MMWMTKSTLVWRVVRGSRLGELAAISLIAGLVACVASSDEPEREPEAAAESSPRLVADPAPEDLPHESAAELGVSPTGESALADCVYIQWCNRPDHPYGTVCRLRSGCSYNSVTVDECIRDTYAVCGTPVAEWVIY